MQRFRTLPLFLSAVLPSLALASDPQNSATAAHPSAPAEDIRVYVDPETGELTHEPVTEEQRRDAANEADQHRHDGENVRIVRHADGSKTGYLDGQFEQSSVVVVDAQGRLKAHCADADHADRGQHANPDAAPPATVERDDR